MTLDLDLHRIKFQFAWNKIQVVNKVNGSIDVLSFGIDDFWLYLVLMDFLPEHEYVETLWRGGIGNLIIHEMHLYVRSTDLVSMIMDLNECREVLPSLTR